MTEKEAIENIKEYIRKCNYTWSVKSIFNEYIKHLNGAYVSYTARDVIENCHKSLEKLSVKALEEIEQYRAIGTVEECREAVERRKAKRPDYEGDGEADGYPVYDTWICPHCGEHYEIEYEEYKCCPKCGQEIDWSEVNR